MKMHLKEATKLLLTLFMHHCDACFLLPQTRESYLFCLAGMLQLCIRTLGSILKVSVWRVTLPSACCVYIRRETGRKTVGVMQMSNQFFLLETRYPLLLFVILQDDDDKEGRIGTKVMSGFTRHYTEKRNDVGEFCTLQCVRTIWHTAMTTVFSRICWTFTSTVCAYSIDTECYNIEANHDKVLRTYRDSPDIFLSCI